MTATSSGETTNATHSIFLHHYPAPLTELRQTMTTLSYTPTPFLEENLEHLTTPQLKQAAKVMSILNFMIIQHHPQRPYEKEFEYERRLAEYNAWHAQNYNNSEERQSRRVMELYNLVQALIAKRKKLKEENHKMEKAREKKRVEDQGGKEKRAVVTLREMNVVITCIDTDTEGRHSWLSRFPPS